jgi:hypothetical protein
VLFLRRASVGRFAAWGVAAALVVTLAVACLSLTLYLRFHERGVERMREDWSRLEAARALGRGEPVDSVFARVYSDSISPAPSAAQIRNWYDKAMDREQPIWLDAAMAAYAQTHFGGVGAVLPPGLYIAASPIGPDFGPIIPLSHYALFTRHGYLLLVREGAPAIEVSASPDSDFPGARRANGSLYATMQIYAPGSPSFAETGEPVHDLYLITRDIASVERVLRNLDDAVSRLQRARLPYRLFNRNSNSALACVLRATGAPTHRFERLLTDPLFQTRLPGIGEPIWRAPSANGLKECTS